MYPDYYDRFNSKEIELLIFDHLLNVVGNGINEENILEEISDKNIDTSNFNEYTKQDNFYNFEPYPNFSKEYSLIWKTTLLDDKIEWLKKVKEFYIECMKRVNGNQYHGAYPHKEEKKSQINFKDMKDYLQKYYSNKSNEEISAEYKCKYDGDLEDFMTRRWNTQKVKILEFINETCNMLDKKIKTIEYNDKIKNKDTTCKKKI